MCIGLLTIFSLYSTEANIIEESKSDIQINNNNDKTGNRFTFEYNGTLLYFRIGHSFWETFFENNNFLLGLDVSLWFTPSKGMPMTSRMHTFGLEYQRGNNKNDSRSIFRINYTHSRFIFFHGAGIGLGGFYNISNNDIGIAPAIGAHFFLGIIIVNYFFRYNFVINNFNNSHHEAILSLSISIPITYRWLLW